MDIIYQLGEATAAEVLERLPDPPGYSSVRSTLSILTNKGLLTYRQDGQRYVYAPAHPRDKASRAALARLLDTFFAGSAHRAMAALLDMSSSKLTPEQLDELSRMIADAKRGGQ